MTPHLHNSEMQFFLMQP